MSAISGLCTGIQINNMSGLDYTKKTELRNGIEEGKGSGAIEPGLSKASMVQRLQLWWYRFSFLRRTRGERWLLYLCLTASLGGMAITLYTLSSINEPVPIQFNCPT
jgi:hypothetical protein